MIKTQIGLGVLSIPSVLDTLGMGPGLVVLLVIGGITTWSNYEIGVFKKNHPSVYGIDDVGFKLFGRAGKEFFAVVFVLCKTHAVRSYTRTLTSHSLDLRRRCWYARHINLTQCRVDPWSMHCNLCRSRSRHWLRTRKYPDSSRSLMACLGWCGIHLDRK